MLRVSSLFGAAFVVISLSSTAMGADYQAAADELRGSYPEEWGFSNEPDPLDIEMGLRYWYSLGSHQMSAFGGNYSSSDTSHILEGHFRIDDNSTASYLKGQIGYAAKIDGTYTTPQFATGQTMSGGYLGYAGADFGMIPFGNESVQLGGFIGYQYLADNPDMGRANFTTTAGGGDSKTNALEIHAIRIGGALRMNMGDTLDLNLEAALIPYAKLNGTYGALYSPNFSSGGKTYTQGSAGSLDGRLYGASGEAMIGFHPTDNITIRVGARGWYLTGESAATFVTRDVAASATEQSYITNTTGLEFFRYGALAELTGKF